jgi:[ribosomal protein S5]-alanine N-acetyltransferase
MGVLFLYEEVTELASRIYFEKFLSEDDFSYHWKLVSNEEVMKMNYGRVFTAEEAKMIFERILNRSQKHRDFGDYKVFETRTNTFIGSGTIILNDDFTEAEIEYLLLPYYWGNGYGSEIAVELLNKANKVMSIQKVRAITDPNNMVSKKILLKQGFISQKVYEIDDGSFAEEFSKEIYHINY